MPKKFSNARWIYQQIQRKVLTSTSTRNVEERREPPRETSISRVDSEEGDEERFDPKFTSTPKKSQTDQSDPMIEHFLDDWQTESNAIVTGKQSMIRSQAQMDTKSNTFSSQFIACSNQQITTTGDLNAANNSGIHLGSDFEMDQNFSFHSHIPSTTTPYESPPSNDRVEDEEWKDCFDKSSTPVQRESSSRKKGRRSRRRRSRRSTDANKENVAIKHVRKLIMYVNNY